MEFSCYLVSNPFGALLNITLPKAKGDITTLGKVSILGLIKSYTLFLSMVKQLKLVGVAMPVITIELNNGIVPRKIGINCELVGNQFLGVIGQTKRIQNSISLALQAIGTKALLLQVHLTQHSSTSRVFITASQRTISNVVMLITRRRPFESLTTYFARIFNLVSSLPLIKTGYTTKVVLASLKPKLWKIEFSITPFAANVLSSTPVSSSSNFATFGGAISLAGIEEWLKGFAANLTRFWIALAGSNTFTFARAIFTCALSNCRWRALKFKFFLANLASYGDCWHRTIVA